MTPKLKHWMYFLQALNLFRTKETLEAGNFLSVINILMQLRKVGISMQFYLEFLFA